MARSPSFQKKKRHATLLAYALAPFRIFFFHRQKKPHSVSLCCGPVPFSFQQNMEHHVFNLFWPLSLSSFTEKINETNRKPWSLRLLAAALLQ